MTDDDAAPPPPPPLPPPPPSPPPPTIGGISPVVNAVPDAAAGTVDGGGGVTVLDDAPTKSAVIDRSILAQACATLERWRSLHAEREACELFASSLLAHPLGGGGGEGDRTNAHADVEGLGSTSKIARGGDALHPVSLPGGVRDAWSSLSRAARPLGVLAGEIDDLDGIEEGSSSGGGGGAVTITAAMIERELARERRHENEEYGMSNGQLSVACRTAALRSVITRGGELVDLLDGDAIGGGGRRILEVVMRQIGDADGDDDADPAAATGGSMELTNCFYARLSEVKAYHSLNDLEGDRAVDPATNAAYGYVEQLPLLLSGQKRKHGHPLADGYDISSMIAIDTGAVRSGEVYTPEELFGKYLDLVPIYEVARTVRHAFASPSPSTSAERGDDNMDGNDGSSASIVSYLDFLSILSRGLNTSIPESAKLRDRRKYARFLQELQKYLIGFLKRTSPFLDVSSEVVAKAVQSFEKEWGERGGVDGWECRITEAAMVLDKTSVSDNTIEQSTNVSVGIDLSKYSTSLDLEKEVSGDELKVELDRLGLKCGGTVKDRAARLFLTKDTPLDKLPAKVFAKKKGAEAETAKLNALPGSSANTLDLAADRRVDIARQEAIVTSLLDQLRPTLEGTRRRIERRTTQTEKEKDQELDEEINGTSTMDIPNARIGGKREGGGNDSADEDDEDDAPIYNPKNVPLDWNGKPIPYWLFKLHGLNHFYACEICGNESYRGRRNFEKHFAESRHAYGMRCLSIPNTKHFHGVTKIADAQELWGRLRKALEGNLFDVDQEEEYEDSHGNVVNRVQYEDLARQGML
ncbi:hypothetical protein ACHAXA_002958 [Cyclostephanos tholiformis]|uniref:Splicing factor 3a n=1 Tax=Cyclostephanos tholiformis TaxID=382380 RepID=A0ABD3RXY8_9STRA